MGKRDLGSRNEFNRKGVEGVEKAQKTTNLAHQSREGGREP